MKPIKFIQVAFSVLVVLFVAAAYMFPGVADVLTLVGTSGALLANIPVTGPVSYETTNTAAPNHLERDISKKVTKVKPDDFPLDTLLRSIRPAETAINVKVEYETVTYRGRAAVLTAGFTAAGNTGDASVALSVSPADIFQPNDTVYIPTILGGDSKPLSLLVMAVGTTTITVTAVNGVIVSGDISQRLPTIANSTPIYRGAPAWDEQKSFIDPLTQLPSQDFNFCEIKAVTIERTQLEAKTRAYSRYSFQDKVEERIYDLRSSCEQAALFGRRGRIINSTDGNKIVYTQNGITNIITQTKSFGTGAGRVDPSTNDIVDMLEQAFAGNNGSDKRLLLAGKKLISGLQKISYDKQVQAMGTSIMHGIKVMGLETNFGELYIKHSKMMDLQGWEKKGVVIDLDNLYKHDIEKMHKTQLDPDKAGTRRVQDAMRILENSTITLRNLDTHLIWQPELSGS